MKMYYNTVTDTSGTVVNGATVTVYEDGGAVASIYDYLGAPMANPFLSGLNRSEGEIEFAAVSGKYDIKIVNGSETDWLRDEVLFDPADPGTLGSTTPGVITCSTFTSSGIDDNATGERVQIEDGSLNLGTAGSSYPITHAANDQSLELAGGNAANAGGAVKAYGGAHSTMAGDIEILSGGNVLAHWDEDNGELIISTGTGPKTEAMRLYDGGAVKIAGNAIVTGNAISPDDTSSLGLFGGNATNTGGGIVGYGSTHATLPGDVSLVSGANALLSWDESAGTLDIASGTGVKTSAIAVNASQVVAFAQIPNVAGSNLLRVADIGNTVQGYNVNTALTTDITYETLVINGDVGTTAGTLAIGDHAHAGVYEPVDADIARQDVAANFTAGLQKSGVDVATLGANTFTQNQVLRKPASASIFTIDANTGQSAQIVFSENNVSALKVYNYPAGSFVSIVKLQSDGTTTASEMRIYESGVVNLYTGTLQYGGVEVATKGANAYTGAQTPAVDNTLDFGDITHRWQDIYATNDVIQTSDARLKDNITDVNPVSAEALISALRPRSFKWKDYDQDIYSTPEDGSEPVVVDTIHHAYTRTHYGLIAQEFEQALISIGINPADMAGFIHDPVSDRYGVRYNELISPMISVIQSLMAKNTALEDRVTATEARLTAAGI